MLTEQTLKQIVDSLLQDRLSEAQPPDFEELKDNEMLHIKKPDPKTIYTDVHGEKMGKAMQDTDTHGPDDEPGLGKYGTQLYRSKMAAWYDIPAFKRQQAAKLKAI